MRPDQDTRLTSLGRGNNTCEKCMMELYADTSDSVCEDCQLNPMKHGDSDQFIKDAIQQEASCSPDELLRRFEIMNKSGKTNP